MAEVKWIKIVTDIFDDDKILLIESLPEHDAIIVIWFKLLCLAGKMNNHGVFIMNGRIAYTDEMFATIFRRPLNTVRLALDTFEKFGMIERIDNVVTIPNWSKHQTLDQLEERKKYMRTYMQKYREKQKLLIKEKDGKECKINSKVNSKVNVNSLDIDKDIDIEEDIERDKEKDYKDNKINLINDKSDKALRVDCHPLTLELIKRNYITEHDLDIPSYNVLFDAMSNNYPKEQLYTTISYIVSKSRGKQIDNKYAYFETALIKGLNRKQLEYKANGEVEVY
jgi:predicted phage replisome organizer